MTKYEIPLISDPQTFEITLAGTPYSLTVRWNKVTVNWTLDIADSNGNNILAGLVLTTGVDLFAQYAYLNLGGTLTVETDGDLTATPTLDNLGIHSHLYFTTPT
jgi:hypothetical protein